VKKGRDYWCRLRDNVGRKAPAPPATARPSLGPGIDAVLVFSFGRGRGTARAPNNTPVRCVKEQREVSELEPGCLKRVLLFVQKNKGRGEQCSKREGEFVRQRGRRRAKSAALTPTKLRERGEGRSLWVLNSLGRAQKDSAIRARSRRRSRRKAAEWKKTDNQQN